MAAVLGGGAAAQAATLQVTTTADHLDLVCDADCTLRDALDVAN